MNNLREIAQKFKTEQDFAVYENEPMAQRFSFKVGGITPLLIEPLTENALISALTFLKQEKVPYFVLGGGTNIVFSDQGFDGVVLSTVKLNKIEVVSEVSGKSDDVKADARKKDDAREDGEKNCIDGQMQDGEVVLRCQCGVLMNTLVNYCTKNGLTGLEQFCGLPGTVGGACYMNARCFDREISDVAGNIGYFDEGTGFADCDVKVLDYDKNLWAYKKSPFTDTEKIVLYAEFRVKKTSADKKDAIQSAASLFMKERVEKGHFKFPCAGSVFKNNHDFGRPTGKIIDELGLKGYSIGDAQIAPWHGNIIINKGKATQSQISQLVEYIKAQALEKFGFKLEEEIIFK
ncbi:UDP-N-acetylmuramate dehydrogenase [Treponema sp.]|uniref:UDP-N-acetylmuramate dehydrogenase n=1 Tax=Treponema sp. TaxID=166 RepID=UPI00298DEC2F|nr:UDP-N-acetylmuramate dehydrogenase [Treponema sp.]MCR5612587.1 UDP-N-acetylmuramate dehydrogenase [Treponema sp.]